MTWTCLQLRFNAAIILLGAIGMPLYWFVGDDVCANWAVSSPGVLPVLLCFTTIAVLHLGMMQPRLPSDGFEPPSYLLQARSPILCCATCGQVDCVYCAHALALVWYLCAMIVCAALRMIRAARGLLGGYFVLHRQLHHVLYLTSTWVGYYMVALQAVFLFVLACRQHADSTILQEFAWTYTSMQRKQTRRVRDLTHVSPEYGPRSPPLLYPFCRNKAGLCSAVSVMADLA